MASDFHLFDHTEEEQEDDYIDMEVSIDMEASSTSHLFCYSKSSSPQHPNEFEFQMFSCSSERETTSPADELFYKGKLLPLHLPPRLQMFEKLFQNSNSYDHSIQSFEQEHFATPLGTTPIEKTPFESCNISPSESPHMSRELNSDEYSAETNGFINENPKKSWTKKLKLIKQSTISSKLKASHAYFKSFFNKSSCSDQSPASKIDIGLAPKTTKVSKKTPFRQVQREIYKEPSTVSKSFKTDKAIPEGVARHRRSFSGAIRSLSTTKSFSLSYSSSALGSSMLSSTISGYSNKSSDSSFLKRSGSVSSDVESSIQGAIAHCKRSQKDSDQSCVLLLVGVKASRI